MTQFKNLLLILFLSIQVLGAGSYFKGPGLIEGFTTITSAAGTTTLTVASETKQIVTGSTTQTIKLPDATTLPLGRKFLIINKSSGTVTVNDDSSSLVATVLANTQVEVHLRAAGSAAGTWDALASSAAAGGGTWGSITGTLSSQTDLQSALNLKAPLASPTFTGTIGTPLTASKLLATDASGNLTATAANSSQATYLDLTSSAQTQLNAKLSTSNYSAKGDIVAGVSSGVVAGVTVGSNGKVLTADSNATAGVRWDDPKVNKNYVTNGNAEGGVSTGWSTYADAAGTQPVDCTGGTPNSTWAASSSSAIHGSNNFLATLNTGASRQGEGVSYAFTTDSGDSPAMMSIRFYYKVAGGTFAAGNDADRTSAGDSDFTVWIYDVTNGTLIQPSTYRLYSNSTTVSEPFVANFQTNSNSTSYRLCIHKGTPTSVSGTAITVRFDDFEISRSSIAYGTPISDWVSYTPTITVYSGSITNYTATGMWRRVGDVSQIRNKITFSGASAVFNGIISTLPSGQVIDTTKSIGNHLGTGTALDAGTAYYDISVKGSGTTAVVPYVTSASGSYSTSANISNTVPFTFGASDIIDYEYSVSITGWSSSTQVSDGYDGRLIAARYYASTGASMGTLSSSFSDVTFNTKETDTTNSFSGATYTIPSSGLYKFSGQIYTSGSSTADAAVQTKLLLNGSTNLSETIASQSSITRAVGVVYNHGPFNLRAGDTVKLQAASLLTSPTYVNGTTQNYIQIERIQSPQTMSATEEVLFVGKNSASTSIATTGTYIPFTSQKDTHGAWSTDTFTCPIYGDYEVIAGLHGSSATNYFYAQVEKGGVNHSRILQNESRGDRLASGSTIVENCNAGTTIKLNAFSDTASQNLNSSAVLNYIMIKRIK